MSRFLIAMSCLLVILTVGCGETNLGSPDNPEKFVKETLNQFDAQVEKVNADTELSDAQKAKEFERIEQERKDFETYNQQGQ